MELQAFLDALDKNAIVRAIGEAEQKTSGEIRLHVQPRVRGLEPRVWAEKTFERLGMTKTALRNGVLLFIACEDQSVVVLGDSGIDAKVPPGFWDEIIYQLTLRFRSGEYTEAIVDAISAIGEHLGRYFPRSADDIDELSNEIDVSDE